MENFIDGLHDTHKYLKEQEMSLDSSIEALLKNDNKLRSFVLLKMIVSKSSRALNLMKDDIPEIEKRLLSETEETCKLAEGVVNGVKTHSDWCRDIIDAIGMLCLGTDLEIRQTELHQEITEMENGLKILIERRNNLPLDQLDKES